MKLINKNIETKYLLYAGIILLLVISYPLGFKKTIDAWQKNKRLNIAQESAGKLAQQPQLLERKAQNLNRIIVQYEADTLQFRRSIIDKAAIIAEKGSIHITEAPLTKKNSSKLVKLVVEGDYFQLLAFLYTIEKTPGLGYLRSAVFNSRKSPGDKTVLTLELWWQNLR